MKMQSYGDLTKEFLGFFINIWNDTIPLKNEAERQSLDLESMLSISNKEIERFQKLSEKGEYSVRFLILLAKLLMLQEKTNRSDAYMFKRVLDGLRKEGDLFHILATATLGKK
jgi:predicted lipid carrier protein YhbT